MRWVIKEAFEWFCVFCQIYLFCIIYATAICYLFFQIATYNQPQPPQMKGDQIIKYL